MNPQKVGKFDIRFHQYAEKMFYFLLGIEKINWTAPGLGSIFQSKANPKGVIALRFEGNLNLGLVLLGQFVVR